MCHQQHLWLAALYLPPAAFGFVWATIWHFPLPKPRHCFLQQSCSSTLPCLMEDHCNCRAHIPATSLSLFSYTLTTYCLIVHTHPLMNVVYMFIHIPPCIFQKWRRGSRPAPNGYSVRSHTATVRLGLGWTCSRLRGQPPTTQYDDFLCKQGRPALVVVDNIHVRDVQLKISTYGLVHQCVRAFIEQHHQCWHHPCRPSSGATSRQHMPACTIWSGHQAVQYCHVGNLCDLSSPLLSACRFILWLFCSRLALPPHVPAPIVAVLSRLRRHQPLLHLQHWHTISGTRCRRQHQRRMMIVVCCLMLAADERAPPGQHTARACRYRRPATGDAGSPSSPHFGWRFRDRAGFHGAARDVVLLAALPLPCDCHCVSVTSCSGRSGFLSAQRRCQPPQRGY